MDNKRLTYIDLGAGVMVLWIIMGHAVSVVSFTPPENQLQLPLTLFFALFWFFYKSGQFFSKSDVIELYKKNKRKLISEFVFAHFACRLLWNSYL